MIQKAARPLVTLVLGVLTVFFPKCPMCWAAYMSVFGSVWLARTPYMGWLFPVLLALSAVNLLLLLRRVPRYLRGARGTACPETQREARGLTSSSSR